MSRGERVCWDTLVRTLQLAADVSLTLGLTRFSGRPLFSGTNRVDWTSSLLRLFTNLLPDSDTSEYFRIC